MFQYYAPWCSDDIQSGSVDVATSLSVLEHVESPHQLYNDVFCWLNNPGFLINKIDFSSHGMTKNWYGHYLLPKFLWMLIQGKKYTHLNRWSEEKHIECCEQIGFVLVKRIVFDAHTDRPPEPFSNIPRTAVHIWKKQISGSDISL